jgi:hypothetical protein
VPGDALGTYAVRFSGHASVAPSLRKASCRLSRQEIHPTGRLGAEASVRRLFSPDAPNFGGWSSAPSARLRQNLFWYPCLGKSSADSAGPPQASSYAALDDRAQPGGPQAEPVFGASAAIPVRTSSG